MDLRIKIARSPPSESAQLRIVKSKQYIPALENFLEAVTFFDKRLEDLVKVHKQQGTPGSCIGGLESQREHCQEQITFIKDEVSQKGRDLEVLERHPGVNMNKILWRPARGEEERIAEHERVFGETTKGPLEHASPPYFSGRWAATKHLGGGMAMAVLWVMVDEDGLIQNRLVRKDTPMVAAMWADARFWAGDPKEDEDRIPMEFWCQDGIQNQAEATNVVRAFKYEVDVDKMLYRLYTEYCPHGDLYSIIRAYQLAGAYVPEAFIWVVFSILVDCRLIMERGWINHPPVPEPKVEWKEIVHRDLKLENIFLDLKKEGRWPQYPQPKLADFGLAFETSKDDRLNPLIWNPGAGTPGFTPPEQRPYIDSMTRKPVDAFQLLAHTNVWGDNHLHAYAQRRHDARRSALVSAWRRIHLYCQARCSNTIPRCPLAERD